MEKIPNQNHPKEIFYLAISRMFERASFFGFRTLIVLYMIGEILNMERTEALSIFGWFTASLVISQIIGAIFGDLVIGNKKSVIFGGILQAIGAFCICVPFATGLYLGLFLIVLGNGLYTPNIISNFGKLYLSKTKLLDSGFTIFHLAINVGSFFGVLLIGYLGDQYGFNVGFILSGILVLISLIPLIILKEKSVEGIEKTEIELNKRILNILIAFILVGLFWAFYEISNIRNFDLQLRFREISTLEIPSYLWQASNSIFFFPISIIAIVLWNKFYSNQFFKIMLGFIFGAIAFGMLLFIPEMPTESYLTTFLISLLLLTIAEIHIAPVIYSILTKYSNPKYLAIFISLTFLPTRLVSFTFGLFSDKIYENQISGLIIGIIGLAGIGVGLVGYLVWNKKRPTT